MKCQCIYIVIIGLQNRIDISQGKHSNTNWILLAETLSVPDNSYNIRDKILEIPPWLLLKNQSIFPVENPTSLHRPLTTHFFLQILSKCHCLEKLSREEH
jgi:hypothetical protein